MAKYIEEIPDTPFARRMADGHKQRKGHDMRAVQVSDDGTVYHTVYQCCGQMIPRTVKTWNDYTPPKPKGV